MPVETLAAVATIVAALIAAALSIVSLTLSKELKTSEFRQAWIDGLRGDLAAWLSAARAFARSMDAKQRLGEEYEARVPFPIPAEKLGDLRHIAAESLYKVRLRLNPGETKHIELLHLMDEAITKQNRFLQEGEDEGILDAIERVSDQSQLVLKLEWERVKKGERPFRILRNIVAPIIFVVAVILIAVIITAESRSEETPTGSAGVAEPTAES